MPWECALFSKHYSLIGSVRYTTLIDLREKLLLAELSIYPSIIHLKAKKLNSFAKYIYSMS